MNYKWMDVTAESQKNLFQAKIKFQNFSDIIDDQLLFLLLEKSDVEINQVDSENDEDKKFGILFQRRNLIKKYISQSNEGPLKEFDKTKEISQQEMLDDVKDKTFVLISDKAGSGKSWVLKNFMFKLMEHYPDKWTSYVDLKQFIKVFKSRESDIDFTTFMFQNIITPETKKIDAEIFEKLYGNGKVCIMFDGFDEIAPDCVKCVTQLIKSFQQNGGNQMWIATRDYFENDLKEKLKLDVVYKLDEFPKENGVELIVTSWFLNEVNQNKNKLEESDMIDHTKNSQNIKKMAENIICNIPQTDYKSIGMPHFYQMIADITYKKKETAVDYGMFKIFEQCVDIKYERWSQKEGDIRKKSNTKSQELELNYHKLHQLVSMQSLFPEEDDFCDLNPKSLKQWKDEEISACGMLTKQGEVFLFSHETFCEHFATRFILRILMKEEEPNKNDQIYNFLVQVFTVEKFGIIRMFLNEALAEKSTLEHIENKIPQIFKFFCKNVEKLGNLHHAFEENLKNLAGLIIKIFETGNFIDIKKIILKNKKILSASTESSNIFAKIKGFIVSKFDNNDIKVFLTDNEVFLRIFSSSLDKEDIENFLKEIKNRTDKDIIKKLLQIEDKKGENLFFYLIRKKNFTSDLFQQTEQILSKYFNTDEVFELIEKCNINDRTILHESIIWLNAAEFEILWSSLELLFTSNNRSEDYKGLITKKIIGISENILQLASRKNEKEFHEKLWSLLEKTFKNTIQLKELILEKNYTSENFLHFLVIRCKPEIIEFTFDKIEKIFSKCCYEEILMSKGKHKRNLLQVTARYSESIEAHQILWKIFQDFCNSKDQFLDLLKKIDDENKNVFHFAAEYMTKEIFEFMINKLEEIANIDEVKSIIQTLGNILQLSILQKKPLDFHKFLWTVIKKYFNPQEILQMIKDFDENGNNLLFNAVKFNTKEVLEIIWQEIKICFKITENFSTIQDYLRSFNNLGENILHKLIQSENSETLVYFWTELKFFFIKDDFKYFVIKKDSKDERNALHYAAHCDKIEFHKTIWNFLIKIFENQEDLKQLIVEKDKFWISFVHYLVMGRNSTVIEFYFARFKEFFISEKLVEILSSKGKLNTSLLQFAAKFNKSVEVHNFLWKIFREYFSDSEILDIIKYTDHFKINLFNVAAQKNTKDVAIFIWNEIKKILISVEQNLSSMLEQFEKKLLTIFDVPPDPSNREELKTLLNEKLKEFESIDSQKQLSQFLNHQTSIKDIKNLCRLAICNNIEQHEYLWKILTKSFENKNDLKNLILRKDFGGNNYLHLIVLNGNIAIIKLAIDIFKAYFNDDAFFEILHSKGELGRNFLQISASQSTGLIFELILDYLKEFASQEKVKSILLNFDSGSENIFGIVATSNRSLEFHEKFWQVMECIFDPSEILKFIEHCDIDGDNILHDVVFWNKKEIVEFTWKQIKKFIVKREDQIEFLRRKGHYSHNILQMSFKNKLKDSGVRVLVRSILKQLLITF